MADSINLTNRQIAKSAGMILTAFLVSNIAGLARQILVANAFGTDAEIEAFNAANRVSETIFLLVAGGALSSAFIPTYTTLLSHQRHRDAWRLASAVANLVLVLLIVVSALMAILAPQVVRYILAPGFAASPAKEALTVSLLRWMLPSAVIFGLSGLLMGILNSHQVFFIPALTPAMYQLGLIFGVLVLSPKMGIFGLGAGVLIGASLHLILQIPTLKRLNPEYFASFGFQHPEIREIAWLMGPRLLGVAVVQLNFWVNTRLASTMTEGSVTALVLGFALMLMPQAAIAQSIAVAAMPTFSAQFALGKISEMRSSLTTSLRGALVLAIPATVGLILLRTPLIATLYQRGEFTDRSTSLVAWALLWYGIGLVGHSLVEILSRAFYAMHDTRTPVFIGILSMSLNVVLSFSLSYAFGLMGWMPLGGLALANSIATGVESILLFRRMSISLNGLNQRDFFSGVAMALISTLVMGLVLYFWIGGADNLPDWLVTGVGVTLGGITYILIALLIGLKEVKNSFRSASFYLKGMKNL